MPVHVKFKGEWFWFQGESFEQSDPLAYEGQCDDEGELNSRCLDSDSFAYWFADGVGDGQLKRFGKVIGTLEDFEHLEYTL